MGRLEVPTLSVLRTLIGCRVHRAVLAMRVPAALLISVTASTSGPVVVLAGLSGKESRGLAVPGKVEIPVVYGRIAAPKAATNRSSCDSNRSWSFNTAARVHNASGKDLLA